MIDWEKVMEYTAIRKYLNNYFDDIYLIRNNNTYYVYDYKHNLIDRFKRIDVCFWMFLKIKNSLFNSILSKIYSNLGYLSKENAKVTYTKRDIYSRPDLLIKKWNYDLL